MRSICSTGGCVSRDGESFLCDFSPPPWGRPPTEVLTYLWILVMVTSVDEATGTVRIIVADQSRVSYSAWGVPGDFRQRNSEPMTHPGFFGARGSPLMKMLLDAHKKVVLSNSEIECLATWMDANDDGHSGVGAEPVEEGECISLAHGVCVHCPHVSGPT